MYFLYIQYTYSIDIVHEKYLLEDKPKSKRFKHTHTIDRDSMIACFM